MTELRFIALQTAIARALQSGAPDANGQPPEHHTAQGAGNDCRHCLTEIADGAPMLVLAHRPFEEPQPYAEVGPIFLHAEHCARYHEEDEVPAMFLGWDRLLIRGYGADDRIVYGTGEIVPTNAIAGAARDMLARDDVTYIHVRSASNNCYQCRIERA